MDRLHKKCLLGSGGIHLLLLLILLVGPAFLAPKSKVDNSSILDVIPTKLIDAAFSGGGNPNGTPPPPAPPQPRPPVVTRPAPAPEPVRVRQPEPAPEPVREAKPDPNAIERERKRKLPDVSTKPIIRRSAPTKSRTTTSAADSREQRLADARRRAADIIGSTAASLRDDISPGTSIEPLGPGGGGEVYASYDQAVRSKYWHAWRPPQDTETDAAITRATVTIASDGSVLSARIIQPSGDASVDRSVRETLDRVTYIAPFPAGAKEKQRTYTIKFDLKARRLTR